MTNRRTFIKTSAAVMATPLFLPKTNVFSILHPSNLNRVRMGVIGTGSRGMGLMQILNKMEGIEMVAICDTLPFRLKEAMTIAPKAKAYEKYADLLADKNVDAVIITSPLNTHATIAAAAVDADKHI